MRVALITGASSGIGAATARAFAAAGYRVVLVARREDRLRSIAAELAHDPVVEPLDASDGDAVLAMAERVRTSVGVPDVIVNNAGAGQWKYVEETSPAEGLAMMEAPYLAAFNVTHAFMADLLARGSGVIVHVNSPASVIVWPSATGYTASRWALRGFHEALCADLAGTGVRSCHVVFGEVSSDYFENNPDSRRYLPAIAKTVRTVTPEECARVLVRVASRPRRETGYPFMVRVYRWTHAVLPWLTRWLTRVTGRKRGTGTEGT